MNETGHTFSLPRGSDLLDQALSTTGARVLIVDDQQELASTIALLLTVAGYRPHPEATTEAARAHLADARPPDFIICDYHLGHGENGIELIEEIRERYGNDIPAVLMTGDKSYEIEAQALSMRQLRLLIKPFDGTELLASLQDLDAAAGNVRTKAR